MVALVAAASTVVVLPALASARPIVSHLSTHKGPYWGGTKVTVTGHNFDDATTVTFGANAAWSVHVVSATKLTAVAPYHGYDTVYVRVGTTAGRSSKSHSAVFRFVRPAMSDPIQGGLTARQEQRISARVRAHHHNAHVAHKSQHWTAAMGLTAVHRARSYLGIPYSWAGGNGDGPTTGVCAHNGGDLDCHIVGFDCSGLTLYAWWPYKHLVHYAATQHREAGRFHPSIGELTPGDLVYFSGYLASGIGHTAIYTGHGMVIEAPKSGEQVTRARLADVIANSGVYRGATRPMTSGKQAAGPHVSSITRTTRTKGGKITVTGSGLGGVTSVDVGGKRVYWFARQSAHRLVLTAPAHAAGTTTVAVSNSWGTVRRHLTYVSAPDITAAAPTSGSTTGGTTLTLSGRNLTTATSATVGGTKVALHVLGSHRATVVTPAHHAGSVSITMSSPYGESNAVAFTYTAPVSSSAGSTKKTTSTAAPTSSSASGTSATPTSTQSSTASSTATSTASAAPTTGTSTTVTPGPSSTSTGGTPSSATDTATAVPSDSASPG